MTKRKEHPDKTGRKTEYRSKFDEIAYGMTLLGSTDKRMAEHFGVSEQTLNNWKKHHPSFLESIKKGKDPADIDVTTSLYDRARGFEWDEQVPTKVKEVKYNEQGKRISEIEHVVVTTVHRIVPPDTRAIQYWLNNRRRRKADDAEDQTKDAGVWADRHEVDHTSKGEKLPAPQVYMPTDLPDPVLDEMTGVDPLTNS